MAITTPEWVKNAVFYQIFPDRFARSERTQHPRGITLKEWGAPPEEQGYQGGDLYGIIEKLDYLQDLGINALYLNPIFSSASNHRYHTFDYYTVDPLLGGNEALRELVDEVHKREMYILLDGVFNHASRGFWQFHHILENGGNSPYLDWFIIKEFPLHPYSDDPEKRPFNFEAWAGLPMLPKFNTDNQGVRDFIFDVARYWINFGIDGWRLDVPNEIDDDSFWQEFRRVVKEANPEAYIVGEIWMAAQRWLEGDQFDAVMNYHFGDAAIAFFGADSVRDDYEKDHLDYTPIVAADFAKRIDEVYSRYDWEINLAQLNLFDSHDTARALWVLGESVSSFKLAILFQMTMPGAPCIYYGDEIGMSSADDPYCREAFLWDGEDACNTKLLEHYKKTIALRNAYPVLRTGSFEFIHSENQVVGIHRILDDAQAIVLFNVAQRSDTITLNLSDSAKGRVFHVVYPDMGGTQKVIDNTLECVLEPREGMVLVTR